MTYKDTYLDAHGLTRDEAHHEQLRRARREPCTLLACAVWFALGLTVRSLR